MNISIDIGANPTQTVTHTHKHRHGHGHGLCKKCTVNAKDKQLNFKLLLSAIFNPNHAIAQWSNAVHHAGKI